MMLAALLLPLMVQATVRPSTEALWNATVVPYLKNDIASDFEGYDAANILMLPMHAAFQLDTAPAPWRQQFSSAFGYWQSLGFPEANNHLGRLQYLYLVSRFVLLCHRYHHEELLPTKLEDALFQQVHDLWLFLPARQLGHADIAGIKARNDYKLALTNPAKSYYVAYVDEDFFISAVAGDLKAVRLLNPAAHTDWDPVIDDVLDYTYRIFTTQGQYMPDGGWLFQKGVWWQHPDFVYAGQPIIVPGMAQKPMPGIAVDTPHIHRMALWLTSLADAYPSGDSHRAAYLQMKKGHSLQFSLHAFAPANSTTPYPRYTNYFDGTNGVYRYLYKTAGGSGTNPYQGSGAGTSGWWSFLHDQTAQLYYYQLMNAYPLSDAALSDYVGPNTTRVRDPYVTEPACYTNGFRELDARMAYEQSLRASDDLP